MLNLTGFEKLACEIIKQAIRDSKNGDKEAQEFFNGLWFKTLCDFLEVEPELITKRLNQKTKVKGDL